MRRAILILAVAALAVGCGESAEDKALSEDLKHQRAEEQKKNNRARAENAQCLKALEPLSDELAEISSRVKVGLNYEAYTEAAGNVRVAYDQIDIPSLKGGCVSLAGVKLETAAQKYIRALNVWSKCFEAIDCENASIQPTLDKLWEDADSQLALAKIGLDSLGTPD